MSDLGRCKHTLYILKHKPEYTKGWGWRCRYCGRTYKDLREEAEYKERERRQSIRSVRGGVEHGSRIIKAGIYSLYHSGSRIIGSRYSLV